MRRLLPSFRPSTQLAPCGEAPCPAGCVDAGKKIGLGATHQRAAYVRGRIRAGPIGGPGPMRMVPIVVRIRIRLVVILRAGLGSGIPDQRVAATSAVGPAARMVSVSTQTPRRLAP